MILHLPVPWEKYQSAVTEAAAWQTDARQARSEADELRRKLTAANSAAVGLRSALDAGAASSEASSARDLDVQLTALRKEAEAANDRIARQQSALDGYERDRQELLADLRRLAEERDAAMRTVERLSREGTWTPNGVTA